MLPLLHRLRRLRQSPGLRALVRETTVATTDLVWPLFVSERITSPEPVLSMPGVFQFPLDDAVREAAEGYALGIPAVILFGIPATKDAVASSAHASDGIIQKAVRRMKMEIPGLVVITDVCLCEFMEHGHCGVVEGDCIANDLSVELLSRTAVSHAQAGADIVAPSDMMDGRVGAMRAALDAAGFAMTPILSYAAKFTSAFYRPFRDAAESSPQFGDRMTYQMDPANALEALHEVALDVAEGADMVMVKPGLAYLDLVWRVKERFGLPTAVFNVSGEYAMIKAAAAKGWLDERPVVLEQMLAFKRAGADIILTYWAKDVARWLREETSESQPT